MTEKIFVVLVLEFIFNYCLAQIEQNFQQKLKSVDSLFLPYTEPGTPGCAVGIIKNGEFIYEKYFGLADIKNNIPITEKTKFNLASNSKQFTATCIFLLQEKGKLNLDDDIKKYLPDIISIPEVITIRQLVSHTSGLREVGRTMRMIGKNKGNYINDKKALQIISREKKLNFIPGTAYYYNNTGYILLAEIIKRVSGVSFETFLETNIFQVLGMDQTTFLKEKLKRKPELTASEYFQSDTTKKKFFENKFWQRSTIAGPTGIFSNLQDLLLWDKNFYRNNLESKNIGLTDSLYKPTLLNNGSSTKYGGGLHIFNYNNYKVIKHGGDFIGWHTFIWRVPEENISFIILSNNGNIKPWKLVRKISDIMLPSKQIFNKEIIEDRCEIKSLFQDKQGVYLDTELKDIYTLKIKNGSLFVDETPAFVTGPEEFYACKYDESYYTLLSNEKHENYLEVDATRILRKQIPYDTLTTLNDFTGTFKDREWKTKMKVKNSKGVLKVIWKNNKITIEPVFKDAFKNQYNDKFFFERDKSGRVNSFNYSTERAMNFKFYKK